MFAFRRARKNEMSRPRPARKAIPTPIAMAALAPIGRGSVLGGAAEELEVEVWLIAAAVAAVVVDDVDVVDVEDEDELAVVTVVVV
jgi:hypothetical protein